MIHWLASYPKSGNTWVRAFLCAYKFLTVDINRLDFVIGDNQLWFYQLASPLPFHQLKLYDWAAVRLSALLSMNVSRKYDPFIVKTHNCNANIKDIPLIPVGFSGPSVYVVRDPRDVALSYASHFGVSIDMAITQMRSRTNGTAANGDKNEMMSLYSSWGEHYRSWRGMPNTSIVRYEDMLDKPDLAFREIIDQFGLPYDQERFDYALEAASFTSLQREEAKSAHGFRENSPKQEFFFRKGESGGWRANLTNEQVLQIEDHAYKYMKELGYV
jgi:hypothetical protein